MFGTYFYHQRIRKAVATFGNLFNNLYVVRKDSTGHGISQMKVPLSYGPQAKFLTRIREQPNLDTDTVVAIKLPRMSFEIVAFDYDVERQLSKTQNYQQKGTAASVRPKFFAPVPYNINFQLHIYAKSQDDALQIVEQIVPYFTPQYSITLKPFETDYPNVKEDVPVILQGITFLDDYDGPLEQRRTIQYTMDFLMKINFYGPIAESKVITQSETFVNNMDGSRIQKIVVTPNPSTITGDSDFGFNTAIYNITEADSA